MLSAGQSVTLGGPRTSGGPWGSNVIYEWTQTDADDMSASTVTLSATDTAKPGFTVPALSSTTGVKLKLEVKGAAIPFSDHAATSTAQFTIRALAVTGLAVVSSPLAGDGTYKQGEKIELAVTFGDRVLVDTSLGTPTLGLGVASHNANRQATYVRGSGTNRLVFEYTVQRTDRDSNGIEFPASSLALNGAAITSIYGVEALLTYLPTAAQTGHKVDGTNDALSGGICDRTPQVRDKLVELVEANHAAVTNCSLVDPAVHLQELTGDARPERVRQPHDRPQGRRLRWAHGHHASGFGNNRLRDIPAGVFDPLTALTTLRLNNNGTTAGDGLTRLPAGLFDRLTGLTALCCTSTISRRCHRGSSRS